MDRYGTGRHSKRLSRGFDSLPLRQMSIIQLVPQVDPSELRYECPDCEGHVFELFADGTVNCPQCGEALTDVSVWEVPPEQGDHE